MLTIPAVFLAGLLAFLSPCFLPVVPVVVSQLAGRRTTDVFIGQGAPAAGRTRAISVATSRPSGTTLTPTAVALRVHQSSTIAPTRTSRAGGALHSIAFMVAFALVFAALWAAVGVVGWVVGDFRRTLTIIAGAALIAVGLHVAKFIRIPFLERTAGARMSGSDGAPTLRKSVLLGLSFGAGWSPCIGPILGGVIALATVQSTMLEGFLLLMVFCAGMGFPLVACTMAADRLISFSWVKKHYGAIELVLGLSLVVVGFLMIAGLLERLAAIVPAVM